METIRVRTGHRGQLVEITERVVEVVARGGVRDGAILLQSLHTTAGLTLNENADPEVAADLLAKLERMVPRDEALYRHGEGNSDSHIKTSMVGSSLLVIIREGRPLLGRWQGIYVCEFDGPRERTVAVQLLPGVPG